ncbi:hypothetical protein [Methylorubrum sp. DB1722]|uniref:hypothetical protein n=1 Tax=Methylorubrum sp. DB1722 TaxID=2478916 RepID=UPI001FEEABE1|nr:hypothetical protein [Methylorubrum sp. DB1722]
MNAADRDALIASAGRLGLTPVEWGGLMSYESGLNPARWGGSGGRHVGLIQFGPSEQKQFGVTGQESFQEQLPKAEAFLRARGYEPGMGLLQAYSTVNAGSPGLLNARDAKNGGMPGTVAEKVQNQFGPHFRKVSAFLGGDAAMTMPSETATAAPVASGRFGFSGIEPSASSAPTMTTPAAEEKDDGLDAASILKMLAGEKGLASLAAPAGGSATAAPAPPPMVPIQRRATPFDRDAFLALLRR